MTDGDPSVHVRSIVARTAVVDGDALLTPQLLARIVTAVTQALAAAEADERSRRRDTRLAGGQGEHGGQDS
jgi:hypothetical protein